MSKCAGRAWAWSRTWPSRAPRTCRTPSNKPVRSSCAAVFTTTELRVHGGCERALGLPPRTRSSPTRPFSTRCPCACRTLTSIIKIPHPVAANDLDAIGFRRRLYQEMAVVAILEIVDLAAREVTLAKDPVNSLEGSPPNSAARLPAGIIPDKPTQPASSTRGTRSSASGSATPTRP